MADQPAEVLTERDLDDLETIGGRVALLVRELRHRRKLTEALLLWAIPETLEEKAALDARDTEAIARLALSRGTRWR